MPLIGTWSASCPYTTALTRRSTSSRSHVTKSPNVHIQHDRPGNVRCVFAFPGVARWNVTWSNVTDSPSDCPLATTLPEQQNHRGQHHCQHLSSCRSSGTYSFPCPASRTTCCRLGHYVLALYPSHPRSSTCSPGLTTLNSSESPQRMSSPRR
jgi:hypothetical protein